jgi:hypothetical protein
MKNSNDNLGNRSRDLPVCSAVPQQRRNQQRPPDEKCDFDETRLGIWYSGLGFSWLSRDTLGLDLNSFLSFQFIFTNHRTVQLIKQH